MKHTRLVYLVILLSISLLSVYGENVKTVELDRAGSLKEALGADYMTITDLTVKGPINYADYQVLQEMCVYTDETVLTSLNLEECISDEIPGGIFWDTQLKKLVLPKTITKIESGACSSAAFESIVIPEGVKEIDGAFVKCNNLKSIHIPASVEKISNSAFAASSNLTVFTIDENNKNFSSKDGVIFNKAGTELILFPCAKESPYEIPENVHAIQDYAFFCCEGLTSLTIPNHVLTVGEYAFSGTSNLRNVDLPAHIKRIEECAFSGVLYTSLVIPDEVEFIGEGAFGGQYETLTIPDNVKIIENNAFPAVKKVILGKKVESIGNNFLDDDRTEEIYCLNPVPPVSTSEYVYEKRCKLYVPKGAKAAYAAASPWKDYISVYEMEGEEINITLNKTELILHRNDSFQFTATISPESAQGEKIVWRVVPDVHATIDENGLLYVEECGELSVEATIGTAVTTCKVTVIEREDTPLIKEEITDNSITLSIPEEVNAQKYITSIYLDKEKKESFNNHYYEINGKEIKLTNLEPNTTYYIEVEGITNYRPVYRYMIELKTSGTTANEPVIESDTFTLNGNILTIHSALPQWLYIFTMEGKLIQKLQVAGEKSISLSQGSYIVSFEKTKGKIVIIK
ncbi:leucine-rich repeat protein [Parabacteroides sp.]